MLGELEQALHSKIDRDKTEKKDRAATDGAAASQEYFFLAASAVKTAISLKCVCLSHFGKAFFFPSLYYFALTANVTDERTDIPISRDLYLVPRSRRRSRRRSALRCHSMRCLPSVNQSHCAYRSCVQWYPWLYQYFTNVAKEKAKPDSEKPKADTRPEIFIPPMASAKGAAKPAASVGFFGRLARLATEY